MPDPTTEVLGTLLNVDFIEKDSTRFPDGGGWGYAAFIDPALIDQNVKPSIHRRGLGLFVPQDSRQ